MYQEKSIRVKGGILSNHYGFIPTFPPIGQLTGAKTKPLRITRQTPYYRRRAPRFDRNKFTC